jgi:hypothetical protein
VLENHVYNLMEQMVAESKSLWRIKNTYKKDASGCSGCIAFWDRLEKDKEDHIKELRDLIKNHL